MTVASLARCMAAAAILAGAVSPATAFDLPFGIGTVASERPTTPVEHEPAPIRMAQVGGDPVERINQLEEANRRLTGRIEELSFQLLQMQEQIRKAQEDNEFRFQDLEKGKAAGGAAPPKRTDSGTPADAPDLAAQPAPSSTNPGSGDDIGKLLGGNLDTGAISPGTSPAAPAPASPNVAAIKPKTANGMYDLAYNYLLAGDYKLAEDQFRQYSQTYPDAPDAPDAKYWLGESLYAQAKYTDAAEVFLNAQKAHPKSPKAPEMMLKLGMSLAKLDSRDTACATYKEVAKRYPQMSPNVKRKLQSESAASNC